MSTATLRRVAAAVRSGPLGVRSIAGIFLVVAILGGNTVREFRDFGHLAEPGEREGQLA